MCHAGRQTFNLVVAAIFFVCITNAAQGQNADRCYLGECPSSEPFESSFELAGRWNFRASFMGGSFVFSPTRSYGIYEFASYDPLGNQDGEGKAEVVNDLVTFKGNAYALLLFSVPFNGSLKIKGDDQLVGVLEMNHTRYELVLYR